MIDQIWKLRSRAIPYKGELNSIFMIQVEIGQGILSMCPNGQGNGFCPSQLLLQISQNRWISQRSLFLYYNLNQIWRTKLSGYYWLLK